MTSEDRLRQVLRDEAASVQPAGDGLARIQARLARRRRVRWWLVPAAALATTGAVVAAVLVLPSDDGRRPDVLVPGTPSPTASASASPTTAPEPGDWAGPAFWPYSSRADVDSAGTPVPDWVQDPVEVGRRLVRDVLQLEGVTVVQECVSCEALSLRVSGVEVGQAQLGHYTSKGKRVFTVTAVDGAGLVITSPTAGAAVPSPLAVRGTVPGVDESVMLRLVSRAGDGLAETSAPAGGEAPWSASLTWRATDWDSGAVLAVTRSPRDGAVSRVALVPVRRSTTVTTGSFAAVVDTHVSLLDAADGAVVRQLTYPPGGRADTDPSWSGGGLVWVRQAVESSGLCDDALLRLDDGRPSTVVPASAGLRLGTPRLSASGDWLAWIELPCRRGAAGELVITVGGTEARRMATPSGSLTEVLDVRDDGALLVRTNDLEATGAGVTAYLPADATTLERLVPLEPQGECYLAAGAGFGEDDVVASETCRGTSRLVHFDERGARVSQEGQDLPLVRSMALRDGAALLQLGNRAEWGDLVVIRDGRLRTVLEQDGCPAQGPGCVRAPDW